MVSEDQKQSVIYQGRCQGIPQEEGERIDGFVLSTSYGPSPIPSGGLGIRL